MSIQPVRWPPIGISGGHVPGVLLSAYRENSMSVDTGLSRWGNGPNRSLEYVDIHAFSSLYVLEHSALCR